MPILDGEVRGVKSATHESNDTDPTGGAKTATAVTYTLGSWFTRLKGLASGTIGDDAVKEYQKVFVVNDSAGSTAMNVNIRVENGVDNDTLAANPGFITVNGNDADTKVMIEGLDMSDPPVLTTDEITIDPGNDVVGTVGMSKILKARLVTTADEDVLAVASDTVLFKDSGDNNIGYIPEGFSWLTSLKIGLPDTTDDTQTTANRNTAPSGIVFSVATNDLNCLVVRNDPEDNDLAPGEGQGIWGEYTIEPGEIPAEVDLVLAINFESGP